MTRTLYAGSDLRVHPGVPDAQWSARRREEYLLRPEVPRPLSLDRNVWAAPVMPDDKVLDAGPVPWIAPEAVRGRAAMRDGALRAVVVAFGIVAEGADDEARLAQELGVEALLEAGPTWTLLGFDVADGSISGLSNCGYSEDARAALRPSWGPRLNDHGLFASEVDALAFRRVADQRIPEHAPFRIYGLWLVDAT